MEDITATILSSLKSLLTQDQIEKAKDIINNNIKNYIIKPMHEYTDDMPTELEMYINAKRMLGLSNGTISQYTLLLKDFLKHIKVNLCDLSSDDIREYLANRKKPP